MEHRGRRLTIRINGISVECCTIGELAAAVGRTPHAIRSWERLGIIPRPYMMDNEDQRARRRLYPLTFVEQVVKIAEREGFGRRRKSGTDIRHGDQLARAWIMTTDHLRRSDDGVTRARQTSTPASMAPRRQW